MFNKQYNKDEIIVPQSPNNFTLGLLSCRGGEAYVSWWCQELCGGRFAPGGIYHAELVEHERFDKGQLFLLQVGGGFAMGLITPSRKKKKKKPTDNGNGKILKVSYTESSSTTRRAPEDDFITWEPGSSMKSTGPSRKEAVTQMRTLADSKRRVKNWVLEDRNPIQCGSSE